MKVKLIKAKCDIQRQYHEYDTTEICRYIADSFSDWEEVTPKEYETLTEFVSRHNMLPKSDTKFFLIDDGAQVAVKTAIAEQIKFEKEKEEARAQEIAKQKLAMIKFQEARAAKKKERLEKQLAKLKEQLNEK